MRATAGSIDVIEDHTWPVLAEFVNATISQTRFTVKLYLTSLDSLGYRLTRSDCATTATQWRLVSDAVTRVLGDVASDRDMGVDVPFEREVELVVAAVQEILGGRP